MPDDDWALSNGTVEFRQEERQWALGRFVCDVDDPRPLDPDASDGWEQTREDFDENPAYGPGNPDWEHDRDREDAE